MPSGTARAAAPAPSDDTHGRISLLLSAGKSKTSVADERKFYGWDGADGEVDARSYATEGGDGLFDAVYRAICRPVVHANLVHCDDVSALSRESVVVSEESFVRDALSVMMGLPGRSFLWSESKMQFTPAPMQRVGRSRGAASSDNAARDIAEHATHFRRLELIAAFFARGVSRGGLTLEAFAAALNEHLHECRAKILAIPSTVAANRRQARSSSDLDVIRNAHLDRSDATWPSLPELLASVTPLGRQLRRLASVCLCALPSAYQDGESAEAHASLADPFADDVLLFLSKFPRGSALLTHLHACAEWADERDGPLLRTLLARSCAPYIRFISAWIHDGVIDDAHAEFSLAFNRNAADARDETFWTSAYVRLGDASSTPTFMRSAWAAAFVCGKSLNLLRRHDPSHPFARMPMEPPELALSLTIAECASASLVHAEHVTRLSLLESQYKAALEEEEAAEHAARTGAAHEERVKARALAKQREDAERDAREALVVRKRAALEDLRRGRDEAVERKKDAATKEKEEDARRALDVEGGGGVSLPLGSLLPGLSKEEIDRAKAEAEREIEEEHAARMRAVEKETQHAEWIASRRRLGDARTGRLEHMDDFAVVDNVALGTAAEREGGEEEDNDSGVNAFMRAIVGPSAEFSAAAVAAHDVDAAANDTSLLGDMGEGSPTDSPRRSHVVERMLLDESIPFMDDAERAIASSDDAATHSASGTQAEESLVALVEGEGSVVPPMSSSADTATGQLTRHSVDAEDAPFANVMEGVEGAEPAAELEAKGTKIAHRRTFSGEGEEESSEAGPSPLELRVAAVQQQLDRRLSLPGDEGEGPKTAPLVASASDGDRLVPLSVLTLLSLAEPIESRCVVISSAVARVFTERLGLLDVLASLRQYLLMGAGDWADALCTKLFALAQEFADNSTDGTRFAGCLADAMAGAVASSSVAADSRAALVTLAFDGVHWEAKRANLREQKKDGQRLLLALQMLASVRVGYACGWPLNVIVTQSSMLRYNRLFSFFLTLRNVTWALGDAWSRLDSPSDATSATRKDAAKPVQTRGNSRRRSSGRRLSMGGRLSLGGDLGATGEEAERGRYANAVRHELEHFVSVMQGYVLHQVLDVSWRELVADIAKARDIDELIRAHSQYLDRAIFRCLLSTKAEPIMRIVEGIFDLILQFHTAVAASEASRKRARDAGETTAAGLDDEVFGRLCQVQHSFREYAGFLHIVVKKLVAKGYQAEHLEDFLLRLDFNGFYSRLALSRQ